MIKTEWPRPVDEAMVQANYTTAFSTFILTVHCDIITVQQVFEINISKRPKTKNTTCYPTVKEQYISN